MYRSGQSRLKPDSAPPVSCEARMCLGYLASGSTPNACFAKLGFSPSGISHMLAMTVAWRDAIDP
jgi:hypothetical protein